MGEVIRFPDPPLEKRAVRTIVQKKKRKDVLVRLTLTLSSRQKEEYSPYFYNMAQECVTFISRRQNNEPYAPRLPREATKQFSKETIALRGSFKQTEDTQAIRRILAEANRSAGFLQSKLGTIAFMRFEYSADMERLFSEITSLLISIERSLSSILVRPANMSMRHTR